MIDNEPDQYMTPELRTALIAHTCCRMKNAGTRNEQEQILLELTDLIRTPTQTLFVEGL